jgi:predicted enzyme related to lactoylglutathione lyase
MFNYRVRDLKELYEQFKSNGVQIAGEIQEFDYGKFGWIVDPEGTKVELWQP